MDCERIAQSGQYKVPVSFYHVAIDCPGYGRSPFDRQTIRSYPGEFLSQVVEALGRKSCIAMCGSSQGAASIFNAALECPKLALTLALCHPVSHSPQRYTSIGQPTLLIYDTEDAGHPVSVGRQVRRYIPNNRYFEFTRSKDGDWEAQHMAKELIKLLADNWSEIKDKRRGGRIDPKLPELTRVAGGFRAWSEQFQRETLPMGSREGGWDGPQAEADGEPLNGTCDIWRAVLGPGNILQYEHVASGRKSAVRPPGAHVLVEALGSGEQAGSAAPSRRAPARQSAPLFEDSEESEDEEDRAAREQREAQEAAEKIELEAAQTQCDLCKGTLVDPIRLVNCRCALCGCCTEKTVRYTRQCPCCGANIATKGGSPVSDAEELRNRIAQREADPSDPLAEQLRARREQQNEMVTRRKASCRIVLEFGNTAKSQKGKTSYTTFLKTPTVEGGAKGAKNPVEKVDFNINPGYSKPTATVKEPSASAGAQFEYTMARNYPCFISVHFRKELGLPQIDVEYVVQDKKTTKRRIVVEMPAAGLSTRRPGQVSFKAYPPRSGTVRCAAGQAAEVSYLPEVEAAESSEEEESAPKPKAKGKASAKGKAKRKAKANAKVGGGDLNAAGDCGPAPAPALEHEMLGPPPLQREKSNEIKDKFHSIGAGDGFLDIQGLKKVLQGLSSRFTDEELDLLIESAGHTSDGRVSFDAFIDFLHEG